MVAPDSHLLDIGDLGVGLESELGKGTVVIETGHGGERGGREIGSIVLADESVGVGRVADNNGLGITRAVVIDGLANIDEDSAVVLEEITALHTRTTGLGTNEEVVVDILEGSREIAGDDDLVKERESTIVELSLNTAEDLLLEGQIEEVEDDALIGSEELATILIERID